MSVSVENLEKNMAKLTVEVPAEEFEKAVQNVYLRQKKNISIPGFRKGKAPRQLIEKMYGEGIFFEDAANDLLPKSYGDAAKESGLDIVSAPEISVTQIGKGKSFIFTAEVAVKPEVTLGQYKGVEVPKTDTTVTDEDLQKRLEQEQQKNSRTVTLEADQEAAKDDTVTLDFEGKVDGRAFEGGSAKNQKLKLGSNTFIPGFEDQLIGVKSGETKEIHVTFPEDYHAEELRSKDAVFTCEIHSIERTELPEIDDDFASDAGFDSLDAYKEDLKKQLQDEKNKAAEQAKKDNGLSKAASDAEMDIPEAMLNTRADEMIDNFARRLESQGMSFDQYMKYTGADRNTMRDQVKPQAKIQIRNELVLEKIADTENLEVSDDELSSEIADMAKSYNVKAEDMEKMLGDDQKDIIRKDLRLQKAADLIGKNAVEVEKAEEEAPAEEASDKAEDSKEE